MTEHPQRLSSDPHVISYRITVADPAALLYQMVANPHRHHEYDGSGTVRSHAYGPQKLSVGDRFSVQMRKFRIPYRLQLRATKATEPTGETPGVIEWRQPTGHRWRWEFTPVAEGQTQVTESYDASGQNPAVRVMLNLLKVPQQNATDIQETLRRIATNAASNPQ